MAYTYFLALFSASDSLNMIDFPFFHFFFPATENSCIHKKVIYIGDGKKRS